MSPTVYGLLSALFAGLALGSAWLVTGQLLSAIGGWIFVTALFVTLKSNRPIRFCYLVGLIALPIGFYWLPYTIQTFGGFSAVPAYFLLMLFAIISAGQFAVFAWFYKLCSPFLKTTGLGATISWLASELLWIRIFPWEPAHTQLAWTHLVQIANIGSSSLVTALMFFIIESAFVYRQQKIKLPVSFATISLILALTYGQQEINWFRNLDAKQQSVALIQANITTEEKHNITLFKKNTERYIKLTKNLADAGYQNLLVIWPESVILDWVKDDLRQKDQTVPNIPETFGLISGALTYNDQKEAFNSVISILPDGRMLAPYHKRILMPFGEYMPGAKWLPWLQDFNPIAQGFTAGVTSTVFNFEMPQQIVRAAPLICYEDVLGSLSREAVNNGADLLVNLTNDAWFGKSQAAKQHNTIASFRAIENSRYLLRATNSGLTAIVNPLGKIEHSLAPFSEGHILANVLLIDRDTIYSKHSGNFLRYFAAGLALVLLLCGIIKSRLRHSHA